MLPVNTKKLCTVSSPSSSDQKIQSFNSRAVNGSDGRAWACPFPGCGSKLKQKGNLKTHYRKHDTNPEVSQPYICGFEGCKYRAVQKNNLITHINAKHKVGRSKDFQCPMCPSKFYTKAHLDYHILNHVKEKRFPCSQCPFSTHQKICLTRHVRAIHDKSFKFTCSFAGCKYSTTHRTSVQKHRKTHDPDPAVRRPFPCGFAPKCSFRASYKKDLKRHMAARHDPNRTKEAFCPLCSKAFYYDTNVRAHIAQVHAKDQTYSCDICSFKTYYSNGLKLHRRIEHGKGKAREKKFKCDQCDYCSHSRSPLEIHRRTVHSSERRFRCEYDACGYKTNSWYELTNHAGFHLEDLQISLPWQCSYPECDFRRRSEARIILHELAHQTCKLQHKCNFCPNKLYPDITSLNFHNKIQHNGIRYKCPTCDFTTRAKLHLKRHVCRYRCNSSVHSNVPVVILRKLYVENL